MKRADLRLAIPAASGWLACTALVGFPQGTTLPALLIAWVLAGVAVVVALRVTRVAIVALCLVAVALGATSIAIQSEARSPTALDSIGNRSVVVTGTTTAVALPGARSWDLTASEIAWGDTTVHGAIPVVVFGGAPERRIEIGSTVQLRGAIAATDPGDDAAVIVFPDDPPEVLAEPPWYLGWANTLRSSFASTAQSLPGAGGDLLAGLAIGDTSAVGDSLDTAMKASSLSHLTAVSGANCAIVIGLVMSLGGALGAPRAARIGVSLVVLVGFVVLVTRQPSVLRAAVMAGLVLGALWGGRPVRGLPVLSLATLALLVSDPWLARSYGFVLSVLATGGLLLLAGPLSRQLGRWLPRWLAVVIAVPFAAQLACQPVILLLNAALPTYGVVANLLAAPAAPVATVVGLAACVVLALSPPIGVVLCQLAWLPSTWIAGVATFFAALPGAQLPWPEGWVGVVLLVGTSVLCVASLTRRWALAGLAVVVVAYLGLVGGGRLAQQLTRPADWQVAMCDVGQGDASVVRSDGLIALIDTGRDPALLRACLADLGIAHVDLLVLTHYDLDHVGGVGAVTGIVGTAFLGPDDGRGDAIVTDLVSGGADVQWPTRGATGLLGEFRWQVLWPPSRLAGWDPGNATSVTLEFTPIGECRQGCLSSIFLGDLGEQAQDAVLAANALTAVDVVKVSHHGSADQSEALYDRLDAVVGLIGVGVDNDYGHPTDSLLDILARVGTAAVRTDQHGLILVSPGDTLDSVSVWTER